MANSLLDFVISLVRDPEAAARYAANPERSIAEAHLTDVTRTVDEQPDPGGVGFVVDVRTHRSRWRGTRWRSWQRLGERRGHGCA